MEKNENLKPVQLPEGHMCSDDCCGDCIYLDINRKSDGKYYCGKYHEYVSGGKSKCGAFKSNQGR